MQMNSSEERRFLADTYIDRSLRNKVKVLMILILLMTLFKKWITNGAFD